MSKTTCASCKTTPLRNAPRVISFPTTFGKRTTVDHKVLNLDHESTYHPNALHRTRRILASVTADTRIGYRVNLRKAKIHKKQYLVCGDSCVNSKRQEGFFTDKSNELIKTCQNLRWTHDKNTTHRSETNNIASQTELFEEENCSKRKRKNSDSDCFKCPTGSVV